MNRHLIALFGVLITLSGWGQNQADSLNVVAIKAELNSYAIFQDCELEVKKDTIDNQLFIANITTGSKTITAEIFQLRNEWQILIDAEKSFLVDLLKDKAGKLDSLTINKGFFWLTKDTFTTKYSELPGKYKVEIKGSDKKPIDYNVFLKKGVNLLGEVSSPQLKEILASSLNKDANQKILMNTSIGTDALNIILKGKTPADNYVHNLQIDLFAYHYFLEKLDYYTIAPIHFIFTYTGMGFDAILETTVSVTKDGMKFFGGTKKETFLLQGAVHQNIKFDLPEINLSGTKPFNKDGILTHLPAIKLTKLGIKMSSSVGVGENPKRSFSFDFIGAVKWGNDNYGVTFPKDENGNYRIEFDQLPLSKLFPSSKSQLFKDLFKDIQLSNIYLSDLYFEARYPYGTTSIDLVGFKQGNDRAYNLAFNFPSLNLKSFLDHEAGFAFPDINLPHGVVGFYIPEENLDNKENNYQLRSISNIPSLRLKNFFTNKDTKESTFPEEGFTLTYGLTLEHFDISLFDFFGNHFSSIGLSNVLDKIQLTKFNITPKTINCKFPLSEKEEVTITAFKMPNSSQLNFIFKLPEFKFSDYIDGLQGTILEEVGVIKNFKLIGIPPFSKDKTNEQENSGTSWKWADLPDAVKFSFPEFKGGEKESLDFTSGFNFYAPRPKLGADIEAFLDKAGQLSMPEFKGSLNPKFLFANWSVWNTSSSSNNSSSQNQPKAKNNPQVKNDPRFRDDFAFGNIPLLEFSLGDATVKDPKLSIDGLKFAFPLNVDVSTKQVKKGGVQATIPTFKFSKSDRKLVSKGDLAVMITADIAFNQGDDQELKFNDTRFLFDQQNKAIRFKTNTSQDSLVYEKNEEGKKELKESIPTSLFKLDDFSIDEVNLDGLYQYESKSFFANLSGTFTLQLREKNHLAFNAKLHYDNASKRFNPFLHIFSEEGIAFSEFNTLNLPSVLRKINHLPVYDIEMSENYFFLGFSEKSIIEKQLDSTNYLIAFKAKGQAKYNFGARSSELIKNLMDEAPARMNIDNFSQEKFIYIPEGNDLKGLVMGNFPEKIQAHFNPSQKDTINLTAGKTAQAIYNGTISISSGITLDLEQVPVGFNISGASDGNSNNVQDGMKVRLQIPNFKEGGVDFKSSTLYLERKDNNWNLTMDAEMAFKGFVSNVMVYPFDYRHGEKPTGEYGLKFKTTNNMKFDLPESINYATLDSVQITGTIERAHNVTNIDLSGDLHLGGNTYQSTASFLKKDEKFNDIILKVVGDEIPLNTVPLFKEIPEINKIKVRNPEISLHHFAGEFTYDDLTASGVIFRDNEEFALILGLDNFELKDISPEIDSDFTLKKTTLALSTSDFSKTIKDLPVAVQSYFKPHIYDHPEDEVEFVKGISLFTQFNPAKIDGNTGDFFKSIGMDQDFVLAGGIGANLSGELDFMLYANTANDVEVDRNGSFAFINDVQDPKFYLQVKTQPGLATVGMGLAAKTHFTITNKAETTASVEHLDMDLKLGLTYTTAQAIAVKMMANMLGKWHDPMGMTGITIQDVSMGIDGTLDGSLDIDFTGKLAEKKDTIFFATSIPATGNLSHFAFCGTADELSFKTFAEIGKSIAKQKYSLDGIPLDIITFKDVAVAFVPPFASISGCSDEISGISGGGLALKGKALLGGGSFGGTYEYGNINATAGILDGISIDGKRSDLDLTIIKLTDNTLDVKVSYNEEPHFKLHGNTTVLGFEQGIDVQLTPNKASFSFNYRIENFLNGLIQAETTKGLQFTKNNEFNVMADLKGELQEDLLEALGKEISVGLDELTKRENALDEELENALKELENASKALAIQRKEILEERRSVEDALSAAKKEVDKLQGEINHTHSEANYHYHKSCRESKKICWWWFGKHCKRVYYTDWSCKAYHYARYLGYKAEEEALIASKTIADEVLVAAKKAADFVPVEADPRMITLITALEAAKGSMHLALAASESSQKINNELIALAEQLKTPNILKFYLKEVKLTGGLNAFQIEGNEVDVSLEAEVFGKAYSNSFELDPHKIVEMKENINELLTKASKSKTNAIKETNSKEKFYQSPVPRVLTFDWKPVYDWKQPFFDKEKLLIEDKTNSIYADSTFFTRDSLERIHIVDQLNSDIQAIKKETIEEINNQNHTQHQFLDIASTDNYVYAVGEDYKLWRLVSDSTDKIKWEKIKGVTENDYKIVRIAAKDDHLLMVMSNHSITTYSERLKTWNNLPTGRARDVAYDTNGTMWSVGDANIAALWQSTDNGQSWKKLAAGAKRLAVTKSNTKFIVGGDDYIWNADINKQVSSTVEASDIYADDRFIFLRAKKDNSTYLYYDLYKDFIKTNGKTLGITYFKGDIYSINADDHTVWKAPMPDIFSNWGKMPKIQLKDIASNAIGDVWGVGYNGHAYRFISAKEEWEDYGGNIKKITVQESGVPLGISSVDSINNQIVELDLSSKKWQFFVDLEKIAEKEKELTEQQQKVTEADERKEVAYWRWFAFYVIQQHREGDAKTAQNNLKRFSKTYVTYKTKDYLEDSLLLLAYQEMQPYKLNGLYNSAKNQYATTKSENYFEAREFNYWKWITVLSVDGKDAITNKKAMDNLERFSKNYKTYTPEQFQQDTAFIRLYGLVNIGKLKDAENDSRKIYNELTAELDRLSKTVKNLEDTQNPKAYDVASNGWFINEDGYKNGDQKGSPLWKYTNDEFIAIDHAIRIVYDGLATMYAIGGRNPGHQVWSASAYDSGNPKWEKVEGATYGKEIAVSPDNRLWHIGEENDIWYRKKGVSKWEKIVGKAKDIAFTTDKIIRIGLDNGQVYISNY